jgi:GNAT superfamily N-acetyltransferase
MLSDKNKSTAEKFWLAELGVQSFPPGIHVQSHDPSALWDLADRAVFFKHANGVFITLTPKDLLNLRDAFKSSTAAPVDIFISGMASKGTIVGNGPAYVGYLDCLQGAESLICLVDRVDSRVQTIAKQYPNDWDVFGLADQSRGPFAVIEDGRILGLSHYEIWGGVIAHIGVVTVPSARGRGVGELVVRQAAQDALRNGLLPQYRTLWANTPSIRIAEKMGFCHFATTVVVRCGER